MDDLATRRERAARNESLFREVNERISTLANRFTVELPPIAFVCECRDTACTATFALRYSEYERIREQGHFLVLPGHEDWAVETVVETTDTYVIVEKLGVAAEIADAKNPRTGQAS